jgi:hypothetical protein
MVESPDAIAEPTVTLSFRTVWGKNPSEAIYLFDQEIAKTGIRYFAELEGSRRWYVFTIWVAESSTAEVQRILDRLYPPSPRIRPTRFTGMWRDIEPTRLSRTVADHPWVFAIYQEFATDRNDGLPYKAFLFRNKERTVFGIKEWLGEHAGTGFDDLKRMAHRIVVDKEFRDNFVSDDPDLVSMWKRH